MTDKAAHMKIKATLKKRQPKFIRQDAHKHKRVKQVWRAPKGLHSKIKDSKKGYRAKLQGGYQTPKSVRGLDKHGLKPTIVAGAHQLSAMDPKVHSIILQGGLGGRKKLAILEEAHKHKFTVLNAKPDTAEKIKKTQAAKHEEKKKREAEKTEKQKSLEQKEKEAKHKKDHAEGKDVPEEKTAAEQQEEEKQKILHKKE
jgi:large subunit ribosomal protein L32e